MSHQHDGHESPPQFLEFSIRHRLRGDWCRGGVFLLTEHLAHVVGALPFLLLLACPLMHVFMHGSHGGHGHHGQSKPDVSKTAESRKEGDPQ